METQLFSDGKRGIFHRGKEIKGLCGGVHRYAAQASLKIDAAMTKKDRFRMKTNYFGPRIPRLCPPLQTPIISEI